MIAYCRFSQKHDYLVMITDSGVVPTYINFFMILMTKSTTEFWKSATHISEVVEVKVVICGRNIILHFKDGCFSHMSRQWCKKRLSHHRCSRIFAHATHCRESIYSLKDLLKTKYETYGEKRLHTWPSNLAYAMIKLERRHIMRNW